VLIAGFPAGSFQANCFVLAVEPGGPCVVVDPGEDAMQRLETQWLEAGFPDRATLDAMARDAVADALQG